MMNGESRARAHPVSSLIPWMFGTMLVVVVITALGLRYGLSSANNSVAVRDSQDLQACRAQIAAALNTAKDRRDQATFDGLVATARGDGPALTEIINDAVQIRLDIASAAEEYNAALAMSQSDPGAFLRTCRK